MDYGLWLDNNRTVTLSPKRMSHTHLQQVTAVPAESFMIPGVNSACCCTSTPAQRLKERRPCQPCRPLPSWSVRLLFRPAKHAKSGLPTSNCASGGSGSMAAHCPLDGSCCRSHPSQVDGHMSMSMSISTKQEPEAEGGQSDRQGRAGQGR
jgi:hypothetical protein